MRIRNTSLAFCLSLALSGIPLSSLADTVTGDKASDMLVDLIVMRPLGLASTVIGAAVFMVGLPFTLPSGNVGESACELVKRPAAYTFTRQLGDLEGCNSGNCDPCSKK